MVIEEKNKDTLDPREKRFYCEAIEKMVESGIPFLVGGAYALNPYTGITRHTKDLDLFVKPEDAQKVLDYFAKAGYRSEMTFPHWLGKIYQDEYFVDIIFSSGNGVATVDDEWFENAPEEQIFEYRVKLVPPEEMLWSKTFIMERERYDGADVAHLLLKQAENLDWNRILRRFDGDWRVLYSHLVLFGFIYPGQRSLIPEKVMRELGKRLQSELDDDASKENLCQGTLISREQYLPDVQEWGYQDTREEPYGNMTPGQIEHWTEAINQDHH